MGNEDNKDKGPVRKNASNACKGCRESKIKCDGQQPCGGCVKKERDCVYDSRDDKRRVQLRGAVNILVRRVHQLSAVIIEAGQDVPPMDNEDDEFLGRILSTLGIGEGLEDYSSRTDKSKGSSQSLEQSRQTGETSSDVLRQPVQDLNRKHVSSVNATTPGQPLSPVDNQIPMQNSNIEGLNFSTSSLDDISGLLIGMNPQQPVYTPGSNLVASSTLGEDHISPDWPFPSFDNMLNFDLLNPSNDLSMQYFSEPTDLPAQVFEQNEQYTTRQIEDSTAQEDSESSVDEENTELVNQLSARLGSLRLAPDGKLRYFGTASHLHLIGNNTRATENFMLHTPSRADKQRLLEVADLSQAVDINLEDHLLRLFFTWHNTSSYIIDEEMFYMGRQSWLQGGVQNSYYNDALKDAMCALGASFGSQGHSALITYPRSMPQFFADRAKILLDTHLDSPCVATAEALVLLATLEETNQNIARGWLFGGMAMRVALDLGLHIDSAEYVAQGILTPAEARARQIAFWGCYISNLLWSFHLGRPFSMDSSQVTVKKPSGLSTGKTWRPYPIGSMQSLSGVLPHKFERPDLTLLIFENWIYLCENIAAVAHALYSYTTISKAALQEVCEETTTELFTWKDSLPPELDIDSKNMSKVHLPHLLMLHMEYHHLQIFLHRPWTSQTLQPYPLQGAGVHHARSICLSSALETSRLLLLYELQYSFRYINVEIIRILSSTALILIFATVPLPHKQIDGEMCRALDICFRALEELGGRFGSARECRGTLLGVQRRWNEMYGVRTGEKRGAFRVGRGSKRVRGDGDVSAVPTE